MIIPIASLRVTLLHNAINLASVNSLSSMFILAMKRFSSLIIGGEACSFDYINALYVDQQPPDLAASGGFFLV
jgi:hypothetical protein